MTKIFVLLALMVGLPFLLSSPEHFTPAPPSSAHEEPLVRVSQPSSGASDHWLDFARVLAGAFVGAASAFAFNFLLQERKAKTEEWAAGLHAMATLIRQYNAYVNVRINLGEEFAQAQKEAPGVPAWLFVHPMIQHLPSDLDFDFESLTFLYKLRRPEVFSRLHHCESL